MSNFGSSYIKGLGRHLCSTTLQQPLYFFNHFTESFQVTWAQNSGLKYFCLPVDTVGYVIVVNETSTIYNT